MNLARYLTEDRVDMDLDAAFGEDHPADLEAVVMHMAGLLERSTDIVNASKLRTDLRNREKRAASLRDSLDKLPIGWYRQKCVVIESNQPKLPDATKPEDRECERDRNDAITTPVDQRTWKASSVSATFQDLGRHDVRLEWGPLSLLGWLITALAVKLGAPFWFDLLSTLVKMRASGKPAETPKASDPASIAART